MVYMSVPDYTSAQWAEMAGVDVAVLGDSLAMIAHGHRNTVPATMDMMVMHGKAVRRGAPNTFVLGCMPYQSYNTVDRALVNYAFYAGSLCDAVEPQGGKSQAHICARWSMPAFRLPLILGLHRTPSLCSAALRFRDAPQKQP
jgi:3-methyl-2-oxobutanoate hydroxymethyltransferase